MSRYGYLLCEETKKMLWLGKAVFDEKSGGVDSFHMVNEDDLPNHELELLNRVVWRFLAEHSDHNIRVFVSGEIGVDIDIDGYVDIGGDCEGDMSFEEYLASGS